MRETSAGLSPVARWSLVVGLWFVVIGLLALGVNNIGWVQTWAHGILFSCAILFGLLLGFSFLVGAVHLSVDTIKGRYPYPKSEMGVEKPQLPGVRVKARRAQGGAGSRRAWYRAALNVAGVLAITGVMTMLLLEVVLRLFAPQSGPEMRNDLFATLYLPDRATLYRNAPNAHSTFRIEQSESVTQLVHNSEGLREDHEISVTALPGTIRLLNLGDSFTYGYGVEENESFSHLLNGSQAADGETIETINSGANGYGPQNEGAWLQSYGWQYGPKIVVVNFFVGNDVRDTMVDNGQIRVGSDGKLAVTEETYKRGWLWQTDRPIDNPVTGAKVWLAHNSQAYVFLRAAFHGIIDPFIKPKVQTVNLYDTAPFYYRNPPADLEKGWGRTTATLDFIRKDVEQHGAKMVVVEIPAREQLEDVYWEDIKTRFGLKEENLERDRPQRKLAEWSASTGTPVIDLLPGFQAGQEGAGGPYYFRHDPHWNAAGHRLAAELIRDGLVKLGLLAR